MPARRCLHYIVSGRVQGVFYRAAARAAATRLGLCGWVRNTPDGKVEVLACGGNDALDQFAAWLWQGPDQAAVTQVAQTPAEDAGCSDFVIHR